MFATVKLATAASISVAFGVMNLLGFVLLFVGFGTTFLPVWRANYDNSRNVGSAATPAARSR